MGETNEMTNEINILEGFRVCGNCVTSAAIAVIGVSVALLCGIVFVAGFCQL